MRSSFVFAVLVSMGMVACGGSVEGPTCVATACDSDPSPTPAPSPSPPPGPGAPRDPLEQSEPGEPDDVRDEGNRASLDCPRPYHVATDDGRCVWSCSEGTRPDDASGECVCQAGLREVDQDRSGRRICR